ncbi:MAG: helix-turn-helix domain-containing protein [Reinekea sp.]
MKMCEANFVRYMLKMVQAMVNELYDGVNLAQLPAIQHHLKALRDSGLLKPIGPGKTAYWQVG